MVGKLQCNIQIAMSGCNLMFQKMCCNLRVQIGINGFKKSLQLMQKVEPSTKASFTWCNLLCNLCYNGIVIQVAACNIPSLQSVSQLFGLSKIAQNRTWLYFLQPLNGLVLKLLHVEASDCNMSHIF